MTIRVDFTPMVDMNMLLITFFMLCTTMIKSQTLKITLPTNEKIENKDAMSQAKNSEALTLILDTEWDAATGMPKVDPETGKTIHTIYWYQGKPVPDSTTLNKETFVGNAPKRDADGNVVRQGIRKILYDRNKDVMDNYVKMKTKWQTGEISKEQFDSLAKINSRGLLEFDAASQNWVQIDTSKVDPKTHRKFEPVSRPVLIIKPGPNTTYEGLINALDEMSINQIARYNINPTTNIDTILLKKYGYDNFADSSAVIRPDVRPDKKK